MLRVCIPRRRDCESTYCRLRITQGWTIDKEAFMHTRSAKTATSDRTSGQDSDRQYAKDCTGFHCGLYRKRSTLKHITINSATFRRNMDFRVCALQKRQCTLIVGSHEARIITTKGNDGCRLLPEPRK